LHRPTNISQPNGGEKIDYIRVNIIGLITPKIVIHIQEKTSAGEAFTKWSDHLEIVRTGTIKEERGGIQLLAKIRVKHLTL
jgi:hypothetical protein